MQLGISSCQRSQRDQHTFTAALDLGQLHYKAVAVDAKRAEKHG